MNATFLKFTTTDDKYGKPVEEVVAVSQIVRIIPRFYNADNARVLPTCPIEKKITKDDNIILVAYDSIGGEHLSSTATPEGRKLLIALWNDAH